MISKERVAKIQEWIERAVPAALLIAMASFMSLFMASVDLICLPKYLWLATKAWSKSAYGFWEAMKVQSLTYHLWREALFGINLDATREWERMVKTNYDPPAKPTWVVEQEKRNAIKQPSFEPHTPFLNAAREAIQNAEQRRD